MMRFWKIEEDKLEGASRTATPEQDLDDSRESVVVSAAEDDSFIWKYFRSHGGSQALEGRDGRIDLLQTHFLRFENKLYVA